MLPISKKILLGTVLVLLFSCNSSRKATQTSINSTADLLQAMNNKYKTSWFDQFTFVQETIQFDSSGAEKKKSIWYEAIDYPDNFRIDFGPLEEGNGVIFARDSAWVFRDKELKRTVHAPQEFLLMKGGLYQQSVAQSVQQLRDYGYAVDLFREDEWNGRKVYVIGAAKGDLTSKQFWLDAEHFYLHRRVSSKNSGTPQSTDVQYSDHIFSNGGWVEQVVQFWVNGQYTQIEYYKKIDTAPNLETGLFDPAQFGKVHWRK